MTTEPIDLLPDSDLHRRTMVDCQIRTFDVTDQGVIACFLAVPRELFLPAKWKAFAYSDNALEIKPDAPSAVSRQLLPPLILARLMQAGSIKPGDRILDIASGTGYSTALLAGLANEVVSLESETALASLVEINLRTCGVQNARVVAGPLTQGAAKTAPYDVIFVNGAVETELVNLFAQLKEGGRLLAIQRLAEDPNGRGSKAVRFEKTAGITSSRDLFDASAILLAEFQNRPQFVF